MHGGDPGRRWWSLAIFIGLVTFTAGAAFSVAALSPFIINELGLSKGQYGLLASTVMLAGLLTTLAVGLLIDHIGVRPVIFLGSTIMGVSMLAFFVVPPTYLFSAALLFLAGIGFSSMTPLSNAGIIHWFPPAERGLALGLSRCGVPLGKALVAATLPPVALLIGWNGALATTGLAILPGGVLAWWLYREGYPPRRQRPVAASKVPPAPQAPPARAAAVPRESVRHLLRNNKVAWLCSLGVILTLLQFGVFAFMVPYLHETFGMSVVQAGTYLSLSQLTGLVSRPLSGFFSDRGYGGSRKSTLVATALAASLATAAFGLAPATTPAWAILTLTLAVGATTQAWVAPLYTMILEHAGKRMVGAASGVASTVFKIGTFGGPPAFGLLIDFTTSYAITVVLFSGSAAAATLLFIFFFRTTDLAAASPDPAAGAPHPDQEPPGREHAETTTR